MAMLHLVNKSPYDTCSLNTASTIMKDGDSLLLIEDGVYGAMKGGKAASLLNGLKVAVLGPDLAARGIPEDKLLDGVDVIDYSGFVDLVAASDRVQSWL